MSKVQFVSYLPKFRETLRATYTRNLTEAGLIWDREMKRTLSNRASRTGATYRIPGTKVRYTASAPNEAPALVTGALRASYYSEVDRNALSVFLGSELTKALWLERGTRAEDGSWRIAPRPALQPSFDNARDKIIQALTRGI